MYSFMTNLAALSYGQFHNHSIWMGVGHFAIDFLQGIYSNVNKLTCPMAESASD